MAFPLSVGLDNEAVYHVLYVTDGGCTESPATIVRTSPAPPDDVTAPVATPISQSYISVVWQAAGRANGPNVRYELNRMKILQPLDSKLVFLRQLLGMR